jgi:NitT/TauT family transport system permease protein
MSGRGGRIALLSVAIVVALWEGLVAAGVLSPLVVSSPSRIASAAAQLAGDPAFAQHVWTSATEFVMGYVAASILGLGLGLLAGWYRRLGHLLDPLMTVFYVTPRVALLPVLVLWFGYGPAATTVVVFLGAFFMVFLTTTSGVRTVDPQLVRTARSFMASDRRVFVAIVVPATIPFIVTGLRLGVGRALTGVLIGELFAASAGLGYMIHVTGSTLQVDRMLVAVLLVSAAGLMAAGLLSIAERRIDHWRPRPQEV